MHATAKKSWYKSKTFWGAFLIAVFFWIYVSLNENYRVVIQIPLTVKAPKNKANETILPSEIHADISGSGWYLLNHLYLNNIKRCYIRLDNVQSKDSIYTITSVDMQKGLQNISKVSFNRFFPDIINVKATELATKEVEVVPNIKIKPANGFSLVGNIKVTPANITIKGSNKLLNDIEKWFTKELVFEDVSSSFSTQVELSDSLNSVAEVTPNKVTISAAIQPYAELKIDDIPIQIRGNTQLLNNHILKPNYFSVTLYGGIDVIKKVEKSDISISIHYQDILEDSTGILKPKVTIPPYTNILKVEPKYIFHSEIIQ